MENLNQTQEKPTLTDQMRIRFRGLLNSIGGFLNNLGITPNAMTIFGLIGNTVGAVFLAQGQMTIGGLIILAMGPVDALDGTMARLRGMSGQFGALVDSVTDRYSELIIFGGLLFYYVGEGNSTATMLVFAASAGSVLVSYIRSRGQSLGWDTKVGILTRMERYLVLAPTLIFEKPLVGLWIIAIFANITALQRIIDVRRQAYTEEKD